MKNNSQGKDDIVKLFLCAARSHHRLFEKNVVSFGTHRSQHRILMYLSHRINEATTQKDIAANFEISAAAVAVSVRKLERDGYIERAADENDNRSNLIRLTDKGMEIVSRTKSLINSLDEAMFSGFTDEEIVLFSSYLSRLCDNIRTYKENDVDGDFDQ